MRSVFKYIFMVAFAIGLLSCEGSGADASVNGGGEETVPEGVLRFFADKDQIVADGSDMVTFRVMYGSEDVSDARNMHLVCMTSSQQTDMAPGACSFSTSAPGEYVFKAYLYRGGDVYSDNEVKVTAVPMVSDRSYRQKTVALQFTAVGCTNCPVMSLTLKEYQQNHPGELITLAFHTNYEVPDPMAIAAADTYHNYFKLSGYPSGVLNFRATSPFGAASNMEKLVNEEKEDYPSTCGVALETSYDSGSRSSSVTMKVTSTSSARYKYHLFLVEDGIKYMQAGADGDYIHNNVVRYTSAPDATGTNLNGSENFVPGVEVQTLTRTIDIPAAWNPENIRVVGVALSSLDNGKTWGCNNASECRLGESVDYELSE